MISKTVCALLGLFYLSLFAETTTPGVPGRIIFQFKPELRTQVQSRVYETGSIGNRQFDSVATRLGFYRIERVLEDPNLPSDVKPYGLDLLYQAYFPESTPVEEVSRALSQIPIVELAHPDYKLIPCRIPNDSIFPQETHLSQIQAPAAWNLTIADTTAIVAVIDGGVYWMHEDIQPSLWINKDEDINHNGRFDTTDVSSGGDLNGIDDDGNGLKDDVIGWNYMNNSNNPYNPGGVGGHGTATWGIATAATDNTIGIASLGWGARGIAFCIATPDGFINVSSAIKAMYYARAKGACAVSMSWGNYSPLGSLYNAIKYCHDHGMILCGGAGNDHSSTPFYPAAYDLVIGVAGTDTESKPASFTNFGDWIDVCTPAVNVWTTGTGGGYGPTSATSFCTPIVAGLAALIKSANPNLTASQMDDIIFSTCDPIGDSLYDQGLLGHGQINAEKAVQAALLTVGEKPDVSRTLKNWIRIEPNPSPKRVTISFRLSESVSKFQIYDVTGKIIRTLYPGPTNQTLVWDSRDDRQRPVPAGTYFIQPSGSAPECIAKIVIVR